MLQAGRSGFRGIYPMVYSLFDSGGQLSRPAMRCQLTALAASGAHGIAVLGLASEVNKLTLRERRMLLDWVAEDRPSNLPLAATVAEPSIEGQIEFVKEAAKLGASWVILQPPQVKGVPEAELIRFFGAIAERSPVPVGIQNAPQYLGVGLSPKGLATLARVHPNVTIAKLEATALGVQQVIEESSGALDVFNGRGGIEMTDSLRAGAVGIIPGAETTDILVKVFNAMAVGDAETADDDYATVLPLLTFLMDSIDSFLVYGKQVMGSRLGMTEISVRVPYTPASKFGEALVARYVAKLSSFPSVSVIAK
jgi:dihydrodipicolinate synthase/N-acetylneuraminate lyase